MPWRSDEEGYRRACFEEVKRDKVFAAEDVSVKCLRL